MLSETLLWISNSHFASSAASLRLYNQDTNHSNNARWDASTVPGMSRIANGKIKNILKSSSGNYSRSKDAKKEKETLKPKQKQ